MIPKRLIYGNFGNMKLRPEVELLCMKTWEECFPKSEWEWIELNEKTFDVNAFEFTKEAYKRKLYSYVNDFARTYELVTNGGVYIDMDQLMLKPLTEDILQNEMFIGSCMHKEIATTYGDMTSQGLMGAHKSNKLLTALLEELSKSSEKLTMKNVVVMDIMKHLLKTQEGVKRSEILNLNEAKTYANLTIYPFDYFTCTFWTTDFVEITDRTYGIQLYGASWRRDDKKAKIFERIQKIYQKI